MADNVCESAWIIGALTLRFSAQLAIRPARCHAQVCCLGFLVLPALVYRLMLYAADPSSVDSENEDDMDSSSYRRGDSVIRTSRSSDGSSSGGGGGGQEPGFVTFVLWVVILCGVLFLVASLFSVSIWMYHMFLYCIGKTTREHWKKIDPVNKHGVVRMDDAKAAKGSVISSLSAPQRGS